MADIRVERKSGGRAWLWILLVVLLLILAVWLLDRAGYIDLPMIAGSVDPVVSAPAQLAVASTLSLQEA